MLGFVRVLSSELLCIDFVLLWPNWALFMNSVICWEHVIFGEQGEGLWDKGLNDSSSLWLLGQFE